MGRKLGNDYQYAGTWGSARPLVYTGGCHLAYIGTVYLHEKSPSVSLKFT